MRPMLNIAVRAARQGGSVLSRAYAEHDKVEVFKKGHDYVTKADLDSEKAIIASLQKSYPEHGILARESGVINPGHDHQWVIDPLSGTMNFIKGIPHFAVSIALQVKNKTELAVVYNPITDELFTAINGAGAQLNDYRIRVSQQKDLTDALIGTGLPHKSRQHTESYMSMLQEVFIQASDLRRAGSTALDLAYVAAGRFDGFFEVSLKPWSLISGALIAREAGAMMTDFVGGHHYFKNGHLVAGTPKITQGLLRAMRPSLSDALRKSCS
tara:strand:- start:2041 stop:2847 length:807 start_codon:yes stop_codon:yes gene_type:complete